MTPRRGDHVRIGALGLVRRAARDGSWADVRLKLGEGWRTIRVATRELVSAQLEMFPAPPQRWA
jgi:hypothetical protein